MAAITPVLELLDHSQEHAFQEPSKKINEGEDVSFFLASKAYADIMTFILQLNAAMFPRKSKDGNVEQWPLGSERVEFSQEVSNLADMLQKFTDMIEQAPPDPGPRRFGNVSFRTWYGLVKSEADKLLKEHLPKAIVKDDEQYSTKPGALLELKHYLLGSFGSEQRLDYGTGHELSFLAFLGGIWKLGGFEDRHPTSEGRAIVLGIVQPYLELIRRLIKTYNLEPAGSHGVWGLDDHSFVPYIFGSAQISFPITTADQIPAEGSAPNAPNPEDVTKPDVVERERKCNLYFGAIGFIYDVKKGPFWEHSPMLFDISGVRAGWAKINKGMIKMYIAEVLSKFPVVQHFPFGHLFAWMRDPNALPPASTAHIVNQPTQQPTRHKLRPPQTMGSTTSLNTPAPWMVGQQSAAHGPVAASGIPATRAPWAARPSTVSSESSALPPPTRAPWKKDP